MALVIDASVALSWCFEDEASPYSEQILNRLAETPCLVPAIWPFEISNGLVQAERRGRLSESQVAHFAHLIADLPIEVEDVDISRSLGSILATARAHGLSSYDASYLELAARQGSSLATEDQGLQSAAVDAGVEVAGS